MSTPLGATIGLLGGGQLARMTAMAARSLGYGVAILDPDERCAASGLADWQEVASFDDADAAARLAERCAVVSYEIEKIPEASLRAVAERTALRPSTEVLLVVQDRARQKGPGEEGRAGEKGGAGEKGNGAGKEGAGEESRAHEKGSTGQKSTGKEGACHEGQAGEKEGSLNNRRSQR